MSQPTQLFSGRVALITGVGRRVGIGAAIARALAAGGADIFTTYYPPFHADVDAQEPLSILADLRHSGGRADGIEQDLGDPDAARKLFVAAEEKLGHIDWLINNAAHCATANITDLTTESLDRHYAVNVRGTALLCQEYARRHDGRAGGRIINLTSGQSLHPMPEELPYAMTKNAIEALTTAAAVTLGKRGITVNAIDPGGTDTGWMSEALKHDLTAANPQGRVGQPQDAANLVVFLCSPQSQWINGQILRSRG